jgi:hypothetical protein
MGCFNALRVGFKASIINTLIPLRQCVAGIIFASTLTLKLLERKNLSFMAPNYSYEGLAILTGFLFQGGRAFKD